MSEIKVFSRVPMTREQKARIASLAALNGLPQDRAIGLLAEKAASLAEIGDAEINRYLREAGEEYRAKRSKAKKTARRKAKKTA